MIGTSGPHSHSYTAPSTPVEARPRSPSRHEIERTAPECPLSVHSCSAVYLMSEALKLNERVSRGNQEVIRRHSRGTQEGVSGHSAAHVAKMKI